MAKNLMRGEKNLPHMLEWKINNSIKENDTEGIYCMKKKLEKFEAVIDIWDFYLFYGIILFELIDLFFL